MLQLRLNERKKENQNSLENLAFWKMEEIQNDINEITTELDDIKVDEQNEQLEKATGKIIL